MLKNLTRSLLLDLKTVVQQFDDSQYSRPLDYLSGASFGKHVRHILDFYMCLIRAMDEQELSYDVRNRDLDVECSVKAAVDLIEGICGELKKLNEDKEVQLSQHFGENTFVVNSNLQRELSYNLEHCIHHMAILKIALLQSYPTIEYPKNFGIAFSTVAHEQGS